MEKTEKKVKTVKRKKKAIKLKSGDFWLMLFTLMLVIFGVIMVFSASYYYSISQDGNAYSYLLRHGMWVLLGFGVMILGAAFDYRRYKKFALPIFIASVLLLILVLTPLGQTTNGATRWIRLGPVTIMPGEIAKIAAIMFVAWFLSEDRDRIKSLTRGILPLVGVAGLYGALITVEKILQDAERRDMVSAMINGLPDISRRVLRMRFWGGYKHAEIAEILNINVNTEKSIYRRSLKRLKDSYLEILGKEDSDEWNE